MDLLELNKRGMDGAVAEDDEWLENDDHSDEIRVSRQNDTHMERRDYEENKVSKLERFFAQADLISVSIFSLHRSSMKTLAIKQLMTS